MRHKWLRNGVLAATVCCTLLVTSATAFHEAIPPCQKGELGYQATMLGENKRVYNFLSSEDPPRTDTILCQIMPQTLIRIDDTSKGL